MSLIDDEIIRAKEQGDKEVNGFSGAIRSLEVLNIEAGDKFVIPETFKVFEQTFGNNKAQYIWVDCNGKPKKFYPSVFTKRRTVYNEDGTPTNVRMHTEGNAADLFRTKQSVKDGMDLLRGKTLEVVEVKECRTLRYGTRELMTAQIPVINLAE